jgi:hypothetical protein
MPAGHHRQKSVLWPHHLCRVLRAGSRPFHLDSLRLRPHRGQRRGWRLMSATRRSRVAEKSAAADGSAGSVCAADTDTRTQHSGKAQANRITNPSLTIGFGFRRTLSSSFLEALWTIPEFGRTGEIHLATPSPDSPADLQYPRRLATQFLWKTGKLDRYSHLGSLELQWYGRSEKTYRLGPVYIL